MGKEAIEMGIVYVNAAKRAGAAFQLHCAFPASACHVNSAGIFLRVLFERNDVVRGSHIPSINRSEGRRRQ